jgi:prepilin-type N-terminal cleavage/methylation domain-containing protein
MKQRAFTLIEVLVSIVILAVALTGSMSIYFYLNSIAGRAINERKAVQMADSKMEELKGVSYAALTNSTTSISVGALSFQQTVTVTDLADTFASKQVRVLITWHEPDRTGDEAVDLVTVRQP